MQDQQPDAAAGSLIFPDEYLIPQDVLDAFDKVPIEAPLQSIFTKGDLILLVFAIVNSVQASGAASNAAILANRNEVDKANEQLQLSINLNSAALSDIRKLFTNLALSHLERSQNAGS